MTDLPIMCPSTSAGWPTWPWWCGIEGCGHLPVPGTAWCARHLAELRG